MTRRAVRWAILIALALLLAVLPASAAGGRGDTAFQFRIGGFFPNGDSEFWEDTEQTFTLSASDFDDTIVGFSFVSSFSNNLEAGLNIDFYDAEERSAVTGFVDQAGFPILHDTRLETVPMTVDVRFLPAGRYRLRAQGRQVRQPVFYVGAGAGLVYWEYEEVGDFVDFTTNEIFFDRFVDDGLALELHALAGFELPFGRTWSFLLEGRYSWVEDDMGGDFEGLGDLDLGGAAAYLGASWRF